MEEQYDKMDTNIDLKNNGLSKVSSNEIINKAGFKDIEYSNKNKFEK